MRFRKGLLIVLAAFCIALLGWVATRAPSGPRAIGFGERVPPFTLPALKGEPVSLPPDGSAVLINYWASWCTPCREELPLLSRFAQQQGPAGIHVVAIALDDRTAAEEFVHARSPDLTVLLEAPSDHDSSVRLGDDHSVLPFSVLIGADGRLKKRRFGAFRDADELRNWANTP